MDPSTSTAPRPVADVDTPSRWRNGCYDVVKKFSKSAWKKFGGSVWQSGSSTPLPFEPPIESVMVDEDDENSPPSLSEQYGSGPLEVDSDDSCDFNFDTLRPVSMANASNNNRIFALCAKYGLPYETDAPKPTPDGDPSSAPLRVPKKPRQRVRVACHECGTIFRGEKSCHKCGHRKCPELCKQQDVTQPGSSTDQSPVVLIGDGNQSDNDKSIRSSKDTYSRPVSPIVPEVDPVQPEVFKLVIEKSKYVCHKCFGKFTTATNALCEGCGHERCPHCSRDVTHISYPYDDMPDGRSERQRQLRVHRLCRQRVRHYCDRCEEMFVPGTNVCRKCQHEQCEDCDRQPSKRRKLESVSTPDTAILSVVEDRMAGISLPNASASGLAT